MTGIARAPKTFSTSHRRRVSAQSDRSNPLRGSLTDDPTRPQSRTSRIDRATRASNETPAERGTSVFAGLLAPLRLPERALAALAGVVGTLDQIGSDLAAVREQTKPLGQLVPLTEGVKDQVGSLPPKVDRISEQAEPLESLLPALQSLEQGLEQRLESLLELIGELEGEESHLNKAVQEIGGEVAAMHKTVSELQDDVQRVTDRLPDPSRGPLEKAKDVLTGSGE